MWLYEIYRKQPRIISSEWILLCEVVLLAVRKQYPYFFDMEKAYDKTWRYGIMRDMNEAGLR